MSVTLVLGIRTGDITNSQGTDIADIATQYGLYKIIDKPTHVLPNSTSCNGLYCRLRCSSFVFFRGAITI